LKNKKSIAEKDLQKTGEALLEKNAAEVNQLEIVATGFENSIRKVQLLKVPEAYAIFRELVIYYGISELMAFTERKKITSWQKLVQALPAKPLRSQWKNMGGQLIPASSVQALIRNIRSGKINSWDEVHEFYTGKSNNYHTDKMQHAWASLLEILNLPAKRFTKKLFFRLLQQAAATKDWMVKGIYDSRAKDYSNPFRQMVYETEKEMEKVIGALQDNSFIKKQQAAAKVFREKVNVILQQFSHP
ncbi:MAG TPA: hypothetical protein VN451_05675, partial [Chitinophagaceae bacterium]|nr:hypothetical protein [Chitinophagaceae bacterium]